MPLLPATLEAGLVTAFSAQAPDVTAAGQSIGNAINTYFSAATAPTPGPHNAAGLAAFLANWDSQAASLDPEAEQSSLVIIETSVVAYAAAMASGVSSPDSATPPPAPLTIPNSNAESPEAAAKDMSVLIDTWARTGKFSKAGAPPVPWA